MKKVWMPLIVISAFALILSCGEDNPLAFAQQDLIGVWNVLSADTLYWDFGGFEIPYQYKLERTFDGNILTLTNDSTFLRFQ